MLVKLLTSYRGEVLLLHLRLWRCVHRGDAGPSERVHDGGGHRWVEGLICHLCSLAGAEVDVLPYAAVSGEGRGRKGEGGGECEGRKEQQQRWQRRMGT